MPRPPKRINPKAHRSSGDGARFVKGRFSRSRNVERESVTIDLTSEDTATGNAAFEVPEPRRSLDEVTEEAGSTQPPHVTKSKYVTRPSGGPPAMPLDNSREDIVIDLTDDRALEPPVVDPSKLPALDLSARSESRYMRHSDGWPTKGNEGA